MSAQQLADRTNELEMPIPRSVLANLESGRRDSVSAAEVLVLARALDVPPVALVVPVGYEESVEILPGRSLTALEALLWLTGERGWPTPGGAGNSLSLDSPVALARAHEHYLTDWRTSMNGLVVSAKKAEESFSEPERLQAGEMVLQYQAVARAQEGQLRLIRGLMRERGLLLPPLPPELRHLDGEG